MSSDGEDNEVLTVRVEARQKWTDSNLEVEAGTRYRISVTSTQKWKDWFVASGPDGYSKWVLKPVEFLRRAPDAPWFALMAAIDRREPFLVGQTCEFEASTSGRLEFYANDIGFMYWNNSGSMDVSVEQIHPRQ